MNDLTDNLTRKISQRAQLLRDLRNWFDDRGFLEVQPPCLSQESIIDLHIDPVSVAAEQMGLSHKVPGDCFLQTSPEAALKRMLVAGAPSIYSIGPAFRAGERGDQHNVEFTMLEWYQVGAGYAEGVQLLGDLATDLLGRPGFDLLKYRDVFQQHVGVDPIDADTESLRQRVRSLDASLAASLADDRDGIIEVLWTLSIQPQLGSQRPAVVINYPLSQAALARIAEDDPECAARFELFVKGTELANGYHELGDAEVLQRRFEESNRRRKLAGKQILPLPRRFLQAMRTGLPPCAGVALGVDRLQMVRAGASRIEDVMPFPIELA